jgi:Ca2+-binding RTX toxin-like protein
LVAGLVGDATASSPCAGGPRLSGDGTEVYGSACGERIVVTSPNVREVFGGAGDDTIYVNPNVERVDGGDGDDTIYGELPETETGEAAVDVEYVPLSRSARPWRGGGPLATASLTEVKCTAGVSCYGGLGSQELIGSSGNDKIFGQRGNDVLKGNGGDDQLFGGVGDECTWESGECKGAGISGGSGDDLLSGGLGLDYLNGNQESDLIRGDGTTDKIEDSGPSGTDTLSFATAVTPGFTGTVGASGFPPEGNNEERGVYLRLEGSTCSGEYEACNNEARYGGGLDNIYGEGFENVIGSPYADLLAGSNGPNRIDGGGGADAILGKGGNDVLYGGADGDLIKGEADEDTAYGEGGSNNCVEVEHENQCSGEKSDTVVQRNREKISVGFMVPSLPTNLDWTELYVTGSINKDDVTASLSLDGEGVGHAVFTKGAESAQFDTAESAKTTGCEYSTTEVACTLPKPLDAITIAGISGNDKLKLSAGEKFWETTSPILLGGEGNDEVFGTGYTEDMLVDGPGSGADTLYGYSYDDALINNEGADNLQGGNGNDLLLSVSNCDGDTLQGAESGAGDGTAENSASWAKYPVSESSTGVVADLEKTSGTPANGKAGDTLSGARNPTCSSGTVSTLLNIDDLEGSTGKDQLYGDTNSNNLLGRLGKDEIWARAGDDRIEAKDGIAEVGGGSSGTDSCDLDGSDSFASCNP